jgi:hypothetical protein
MAAVAGHRLRELHEERLRVRVQDVVQGPVGVHLAAELRGVHPQRIAADLADDLEPVRWRAKEDRQPNNALGSDRPDLDRAAVAQPDQHRGDRRLGEVHAVGRRLVVGQALARQDGDPLHLGDELAGVRLAEPLEQVVPRALGSLPGVAHSTSLPCRRSPLAGRSSPVGATRSDRCEGVPGADTGFDAPVGGCLNGRDAGVTDVCDGVSARPSTA